jgi:dTDP-4-amino-4,6-dideoxygalactose transaminase
MQFIDLAAQQKRIRARIEANIQEVLDHGRYIMGPEIERLETRLAEYVGVRHALSCSSGTDALLLALMALGVGPGDAVITTPFTFIATAEVISLLGAVPVFVDIEPTAFNLDPAKLEKAIAALKARDPSLHPLPEPLRGKSPRTRLRGVMPVDLFGLPADYDLIGSIARENGLFVVEDSAQAFGAEYKGKKACGLASIGCASFFPAKPLGCYGDGGMCFTEDDDLQDVMVSLRVHGQGANKYDNLRIGINGRLDSIQAAVLLAKFEIFPEEMELRQTVAERYTRLLWESDAPLVGPVVPDGYKSAWAQYSVLAEDEAHRERLLSHMKKAGIPYAIYYQKPLHLQEAFKDLGYGKRDFPVSEAMSRRIFSLPMHPYLAPEEQERIVACLSEAG